MDQQIACISTHFMPVVKDLFFGKSGMAAYRFHHLSVKIPHTSRLVLRKESVSIRGFLWVALNKNSKPLVSSPRHATCAAIRLGQ